MRTARRSIGAAGYAVMTGGYGGVMGAISHGAWQAGGHVIGVTVGLFKQRGLVRINSYAKKYTCDLAERLNYLIVTPDAYGVFEGGAGTLAELAYVESDTGGGSTFAPMILSGRSGTNLSHPLQR